ncbi:hydantoinase/oxoprolinase N-terminal domain-containing protein [Paractinoplanes atraurantiacus]|uniref:Hydantoinase/oxoprolinase N-terminal region n=1 Tax=Paractinoplanes atraurantiacus TaxID=1036182 RepID=A0A285IIX4_9ACTN|nr:hydantoinase/oxoprolinase N-terminal domain-containing protein [Actinoplanes atraurantiacus]SNY47918.1 Hydantoinase/oxoprolinase N-terminal region [Actinoplanes atraurantiacus]
MSAPTIGVSLRPERAYAAVVHGATAVPVEPVAPARTDADGVIAAAVAAARRLAPGGADAVTVDIAPVLLDTLLRPESDIPPVAVVRIVPRAATDPVLARSPAEVVERRVAGRWTVAGGHDLLGNELIPLDRAALAEVTASLAATGIRHVAVVAAGSQAKPAHEREVADAVQAAVPGARISVASDYGGQGLTAREATVVLDCALTALAERLLDRCERTLARLPGDVRLRVARGDGGYSTPSRIRVTPVMAFGATDALELCGAAHLAGLDDCRVLLRRDGQDVAGEVRHRLAVVRLADQPRLGTELVVPTAALTPQPRQSSRGADVPLVLAENPDLLACVGAAIARPASWLDEVAFIESADELERVRRDVEERATAMVMANGAAPGTTHIAETSTVAVPYSPSGTVRIRVRVAGAPDDALAAG